MYDDILHTPCVWNSGSSYVEWNTVIFICRMRYILLIWGNLVAETRGGAGEDTTAATSHAEERLKLDEMRVP
jgi:hypothetical protein